MLWSRVKKVHNLRIIHDNCQSNQFWKPMSNAVLEQNHQVIGNLLWTFNISTQTYVDKNEPYMDILAAAEFEICLTTNRQKCYSLSQWTFGRVMILSIKYRVDWELIHHKIQTQINRDNDLFQPKTGCSLSFSGT